MKANQGFYGGWNRTSVLFHLTFKVHHYMLCLDLFLFKSSFIFLNLDAAPRLKLLVWRARTAGSMTFETVQQINQRIGMCNLFIEI